MKAKWEEYKKFFADLFYYLLSVSIEGSKDGGWRGALFVWPFLLCFVILLFLLIGSIF